MAKSKYTIIDDQGNDKGFVVVETSPTFQSTSSAIIPNDGPLADSILFATVLLGITSTLWLFGANGLIAAFVGVFLTSTLAGIKAWRGQLIGLEPKTNGVYIEGEFTDKSDNTVYRDFISNHDITWESIHRMCEAIQDNDFVWLGRDLAKRRAKVKRGQHTLIREEFSTNNYLKSNGQGQEVMSARGRLFVRHVAALPR